MSVTQIDNFTVTQADYQGIVGNTLYGATGGTGVVELVLSPNQGYTVTATDFSWDGTPSNGVTAVNFVQDGTDVKCNLSIDPTYLIPSGGISFPVCVSGKSVLIPISLTLNFSNVLTNATSNVSNGALTFSGDRGTTAPVLDVTLTADANNKFPTPINDSAFFTITNTNPQSSVSSSDFTVNKTYSQDGSGNFNSMRVVASYTFPTTDETFNFSVTGLAEAIPVTAPLVINGFSAGVFSSLDWKGTTRTYTLQGVEGSTFNYSLEDGTTTYSSGSGVINSSGSFSFSVEFPQRASAGTKNYSLKITATNTTTLNPVSFGGNTTQNSFTLVQTAQDTVFITRNVIVKNSNNAGGRYSGTQGWVADGLGFGYVDDQTFILREYPMDDTLSSQGIFTTITDVFEVPLNKSLSVRIGYTQKQVSSPGSYYLRSIVTGMTSGDGTTDVIVANSSGALGTLGVTVVSPGAGAANAGVLNLYAQDTSF
jgi:hypothetical protein